MCNSIIYISVCELLSFFVFGFSRFEDYWILSTRSIQIHKSFIFKSTWYSFLIEFYRTYIEDLNFYYCTRQKIELNYCFIQQKLTKNNLNRFFYSQYLIIYKWDNLQILSIKKKSYKVVKSASFFETHFSISGETNSKKEDMLLIK